MTDKKNQADNRRSFLRKGIAGAAGLSFIPSLGALGSQERVNREQGDENEKKIIYRTLGRTGIKVPIISMGTSSNEYLVKAALKSGIRHFDSAYSYSNGVDETTLGRVFKGRPRDSFVVATKLFGIRENSSGAVPEHVTYEEFKSDMSQKLEVSLKRLGVDYVDILHIHSLDDPELAGNNFIKNALQEFKNEGKAKFIGASIHNSASIYACVEEKIYDVILIAYNFRDEESGTIRAAIKHAADAGCGIIGMKALGGVYWDSDRKQRINPGAATKWILQDENVHTTLLTINTFDQLEMYMSLMNDISLSPEEREDLRLGPANQTAGLYCSGCGQCRPQCPHGVDIPKIMRSYMYLYGYQKPSRAKETMRLLDPGNIKCDHCNSCNITCKMGFDIREKITDISRIMNVPDEFLV